MGISGRFIAGYDLYECKAGFTNPRRSLYKAGFGRCNYYSFYLLSLFLYFRGFFDYLVPYGCFYICFFSCSFIGFVCLCCCFICLICFTLYFWTLNQYFSYFLSKLPLSTGYPQLCTTNNHSAAVLIWFEFTIRSI